MMKKESLLVSSDAYTECSINPFISNAPFLYPLKTSENLKTSGVRERVHWEQIG